ncbi:hypothetical protein CLAIMM_08489 [Cladophialophora immunda]|nr:hypothetical protein CLAIMM_08489 [Cladophialophora immunda]
MTTTILKGVEVHDSTMEKHIEDCNKVEESQPLEIRQAPQNWWNWRVVLNLIIVGSASGLFGYDNAFIAPLLSLPEFIAKYQGPGTAFTARNLNLLVSVPLVGGAVGGILAAIGLQHRFGRKRAFLIAYGAICIPASLLQFFSPNMGALVAGRFFNNFGIAVLMCVCPLYLADLVPVHLRGRAVGVCILYKSGSAVIGTVAVWGSKNFDTNWQYRLPLLIQIVLPAILFLLTLFVAESPTWHVLQGNVEEARLILLSLRRHNEEVVNAELASIVVGVASDRKRKANRSFWEIVRPENLKRTITSSAFMCASQVDGQITVLQYSTVVLLQSGVTSAFNITILIYTLQFAGMLVGPVLVDKVGRRPVALVGFSILLLLDVSIGGLACGGLATTQQRLVLASLFIIFGFVNAASFQSLCFLLVAEIPTAKLREPTTAWTLFWSQTTACITTFAVPQLTSADAGNLGAKVQLVFAGCLILTMIFTYFYLPETKGRTLGEIDEMYAAGIPMNKWRGYKCEVLIESSQSTMEKSQSN